jgi:hypothetical protein
VEHARRPMATLAMTEPTRDRSRKIQLVDFRRTVVTNEPDDFAWFALRRA